MNLLLDKIAAHVGLAAYNRLVEKLPETKQLGRLRYWQERHFRALESAGIVSITSLEDYVRIFEGAAEHEIPLEHVTREKFLKDPLTFWTPAYQKLIMREWFAEAWAGESRFKDNLTFEIVRSVSKMGEAGIDIYQDFLAYLTSVLTPDQIISLYESIRDDSGRLESEWRSAFARIVESKGIQLPNVSSDLRLES